MEEQFGLSEEEKSVSVSQGKRNMRNIKYNSLRKTDNILSSGGPLPKYNYTFRIDTTKVVSLMQNIQENFELKAGRFRNFIIAGHKFKNLPVYERGGKGLHFFKKKIRIHYQKAKGPWDLEFFMILLS